MQTWMLYQTCSISSRSVTLSGGLETFTETVAYSSVPCYVRPSKWDTKQSTGEKSNFETVYISIPLGYTVALGNILTCECRRYQAEEIKEHRLISDGNIRIKCSKL